MEKKFNLQDYRKKYGLSQQQLAELIGVNFRYISMIETGAKPLTSKFVKKLELLDAGRVQQISTSTAPPAPKEKTLHCSQGLCQECVKKEAEIDKMQAQIARLEKIIDKLMK